MKKITTVVGVIAWMTASAAVAQTVSLPVASDSRIKTLVYSENDVFSLVTHYGYSSSIELSPKENIETISIGDRTGFQVVPAGRRLFVRAMATNAHTNMTVVTNKRSYQFDLSAIPVPVAPNEELSYVIRFFYPEEKKSPVPAVYTDEVQVQVPVAPVSAMPVSDLPMPVPEVRAVSSLPPITAPVATAPNYNYTFEGDASVAPVKIYDDGRSTYLKFSRDVSPKIYEVNAGNQASELSVRRKDDLWVVDKVVPRLGVDVQGKTVTIYNEQFSVR